jgi:hypothetical protein
VRHQNGKICRLQVAGDGVAEATEVAGVPDVSSAKLVFFVVGEDAEIKSHQ